MRINSIFNLLVYCAWVSSK